MQYKIVRTQGNIRTDHQTGFRSSELADIEATWLNQTYKGLGLEDIQYTVRPM